VCGDCTVGLSARNKRKHIDKALTFVPQDGARALDYSLGGAGGLPPTLLRWAFAGVWVALTIVLSVLLQTFAAVGVLPMIALFFAVNKPRGVLLTDRGMASLRCGFLNGRPTSLLGLAALTALDQRIERRSGSTKLQIGDDQVWLRDADLGRFIDVAPRPASGPVPPPVQ
jgi:hypothetical protein